VKQQVTHLNLDERHRRLMAMRSAQLGMSLSDYVSTLVEGDAERSGLVEFLGQGSKLEVRRGGK
jgi:hypothetical protein